MVCRRTNPDEVQEMREGRGEGPSRSHDRPHMEVDVPVDGIVSAGRKGEMPVEVKRSISPFSRAIRCVAPAKTESAGRTMSCT